MFIAKFIYLPNIDRFEDMNTELLRILYLSIVLLIISSISYFKLKNDE